MAGLEYRSVTRVSGLRSHGGILQVFVETDDPAARSIYVFVSSAEDQGSPTRCGEDVGFVEVSCTTSPLREVVRRKRVGGRTPVYMGRIEDDVRGSILVELFGEDAGRRSISLVEQLIDDDLIGLATSPDVNARGEQLDGFRRLRLTIESDVGLDPEPPGLR